MRFQECINSKMWIVVFVNNFAKLSMPCSKCTHFRDGDELIRFDTSSGCKVVPALTIDPHSTASATAAGYEGLEFVCVSKRKNLFSIPYICYDERKNQCL